ncbi:hypothetical protein F2Q68_00009078 [Brassica cretica]|uniref:Uncharacterized protein n=1 Tax=Brassica cretica TaxID=69181 RepID=A0A8S9KV18_BRACR|nr:hypothetical protein F2Q68_00009078 [Brassica cretica]
MESGIDAPLPSSSNVVGHEIFVSEDVNEPVVKPLSLLSPSAMSSSSLLTVSSPALTDSVCGGSLSLVSMPSASSVLLNTTTGISQVQTIGSDIASPPSAVFSGVDPSRTLENSEGQGEGFMVPIVDIDHILKSKHSEDSIGADPTATTQDPIDTAHDSTLNPTASPEVRTSNLKTTTLSFSSPSQLEKPASPLTSATPPDTLVDSQSTPTATPIMDCYPSNITNNEVIESLVVDLMTTTPIHCAFESSSRFSVLGNVDEAEIELPNSISLTRGGRESKPPIEYQSMEWKTVRGRGKRGRSGRGSSH